MEILASDPGDAARSLRFSQALIRRRGTSVALPKLLVHLGCALLASALVSTEPGVTLAAGTTQSGLSEAEFFKTTILPILAARCQACHNRTLKLSGLSLESAAGLNAGGTQGPAVIPGNAEQSRLYRRIARLEKPYMPMEQDALPEAEVALLKSWIEQ